VIAQGGEGGGAALDQVIGMSAVAFVVTAGSLRRPDRASRRSPSCSANAIRTHLKSCGPFGCLVVLACTLILIGALSWGAGRLNNREPTASDVEPRPTVQA